MTRKQARRHRRKKTARLRMPKVRLSQVLAPFVAVAVVVATYQLSTSLLDRPIRSVEINGPFQRVSALQIEEAISSELEQGFVSADLGQMQDQIVALPWIDQASVARRWPSRIAVAVTEQVPAAIWGKRGLLNVRGELFVRDARHIPTELPLLSGPEHSSGEVAKRYLEIRERLIPVGLDLRRVQLDTRGAWHMTLQNGVEVRLGRRDVDERAELFLDVVAGIITGRAVEIDYVDMRYSNGFAVGWKNGSSTPIANPRRAEQELLASRGVD